MLHGGGGGDGSGEANDTDRSRHVQELLGALETATTAEKRVGALNALDTYLQQGAADADRSGVADEVTVFGMIAGISDDVATALKSLLRNSNQFVSSKALAVALNFARHLATAAEVHLAPQHSHTSHVVHDTKQALPALLPAIVEHLADHREKSRELARSILIELVRAASFVSPAATSGHPSHSHNETALVLYERLLLESGLQGKSAKLKEQTTLLLPSLRDAVTRLPLRPLLPVVVEHLSDADPGVREASRTACISLFSQASPVAKAELKREIEKRGVRKQTADAIIGQVFGGGGEQGAAEERPHPTNSPAASQETTHLAAEPSRPASSLGAAPADVSSDIRPVYVASRSDLDRAFAAMEPHFASKETEHNWMAREQGFVKLRGMLKTSVYSSFPDAFLSHLKHMQEGVLKGASSLRTTLSVHGLSFIAELAEHLGDDMDPLADAFLNPLIKMAGSTKKIAVSKSQQAVHAILVNVSYKHKFLDYLWQGLQDKNVSTRTAMCQHLCTLLDVHGQHRKSAFELHGGLELLSKYFKRALPDQNKDVRALARDAFYRLEAVWPDVAASILTDSDAATRKQVESNRESFRANQASTQGTSRFRPPPTAQESSRRQPAAAPSSVSVHHPPRTPGTPGRASSAILAAKRAAALRLAQERKRHQELEEQLARSQIDDEPPASSAFEHDTFGIPSVASPRPSSPTTTTRTALSKQSPVHASPPARMPSRPSPTPRVTMPYSAHSQVQVPRSPTMIPGPSSSGSGSPRGSSVRSNESRNRAASSSSIASTPPATIAARHPQAPSQTGQWYESISQRFEVSPPAASANDAEIAHADETTGNELSRSEEQGLDTDAQKKDVGLTVLNNAKDISGTGHAAAQTPSRLPAEDTAPLPKTPKMTNGGGRFDEAVSSNVPDGNSRDARSASSSTAVKWFLSKASRLDNTGPSDADADLVSLSPVKRRPESREHIAAIKSGAASLRTFKALVVLSKEFRLPEKPEDEFSQEDEEPRVSALGLTGAVSTSRVDLNRAMTMWQQGQLFETLLDAVLGFLRDEESHIRPGEVEASRKGNHEIDTAALVLLHRLVENQYGLIAMLGRERAIVEVLLDVAQRRRSSATSSAGMKSGCQATMERWAEQTDVVVGVSTMRSVLSPLLRKAQSKEEDSIGSTPRRTSATVAVWTLALRGLGHLFGRLPVELVEDQLEACKSILKDALGDRRIEVRQQAVAVLVAANGKLQDPPSLFGILQPLDKAQEDLITYYMSKSSSD